MKNNLKIKSFLSEILIYLCLLSILLFFIINASKTNPKNSIKKDNPSSTPIIRLEPYLENDSKLNKKEIILINNNSNNAKTFNFKNALPLFTIKFGEDKKQIGKINYDPGASNGISGGAIPTDVKTRNSEILIADGYGPRIVKYSETGKYIGEIDLKELRPIEFKGYKALCGFKFDIDSKNNIYVLDTEKAVIWIYINDKLSNKIEIKNTLKDYSILDTHPYLLISNDGYIFLKLTVSLNNKDNYRYDYIPVNKSKIIGAIISNDGKFITTFDNNYSFISIKDTFYTITSADKEGFNISGFKLEDNKLIEEVKLTIGDSEWEHGDLINSSNIDNIYYFSKYNEISVINLTSKTRKSIILPDLKYHPITVFDDGKIIFLDIHYSVINVYMVNE